MNLSMINVRQMPDELIIQMLFIEFVFIVLIYFKFINIVCLLYIQSIHTWSKPQDIEFVIINYIC